MTKNDAVERAVEALRVAKNVEAAFHEFSDSPQDAIAIVGEILGRWNSCFADELKALQTSRPAPDEQAALDFLIEYSNKNEGWQDDHRAEHDAAIETIRAALKAGEKGRWQDISTAPRDGRRVMLWCENWTGPQTGQFYGQFWAADASIREWKYQPTHWQPLPAPPTSEGV